MTLRRSAPHFRDRWFTLGFVVISALLLMAASALALTGSKFESTDGNLVVNTVGNLDWENAPNLQTQVDVASGSTDNAFGQGAKEDISNPTVVYGSIPPNKSDLIRFYVAHEKVGSDTFLYLAWERTNVLGSANMDFEFNQSKTADANGVTPVRTNGDMLITFDFTNGGSNPVLGSLRWLVAGEQNPDQANFPGANSASRCYSSNKLPCWGDRLELSSEGLADGAVNFDTVTDPIAPDAPRQLPAYTFGEAALNVSDVLGSSANGCTSFGSAFLKSRSSASFTAELKDFISPTVVDISNCASLTIKKVAQNGDATFSYSSTGDLPTPAATDGSFSIATTSGTGSIIFNNVLGGKTYTVTEGAQPSAAWIFVSLTCKASDGSSYEVNGQVATINMEAGGDVECTYTDHKTLSPTISTLLSKSTANIGDKVYDTSTLSGSTSGAGGTVTYTVYKNNTCTTAAVGGTDIDAQPTAVTVTNHIVPNSADVTFLKPGNYWWQAVYSGDGDNNSATSTCTDEPLLIKWSPSIATTLSSSSIVVGSSIHDSAAISDASADVSGTVTYSVYSDDQCKTLATTGTSGMIDAQPGDVTINTSTHLVPDSPSVTFKIAGTYYWQASYGGDAKNNSAKSVCTSETVVVAPATPGLATAQKLLPNDSATISGGYLPTGTIDFYLFDPSNTSCTNLVDGWTFHEQVTVNGNGTYVTHNTTIYAQTVGTWRWLVVYSGDTNNDGKTLSCGTEQFTITNS